MHYPAESYNEKTYKNNNLAASSPDQRVMSPSQAQVNERYKHTTSRSSEDQVNIDFRHCGTLIRSVPQCGGVIEIRLLDTITLFDKSVSYHIWKWSVMR